MARLENWTLHSCIGSDKKIYQHLTGIVFGHPKANSLRNDLIDGHMIITSRIVSLDMKENIAITESGTVYELGSKGKG